MQMKVVVNFRMIFGARMNVLFSIEVKILMLIIWSYRFPKQCRLLSLEGLSCFEQGVRILLDTWLFGICFWTPFYLVFSGPPFHGWTHVML